MVYPMLASSLHEGCGIAEKTSEETPRELCGAQQSGVQRGFVAAERCRCAGQTPENEGGREIRYISVRGTFTEIMCWG